VLKYRDIYIATGELFYIDSRVIRFAIRCWFVLITNWSLLVVLTK